MSPTIAARFLLPCLMASFQFTVVDSQSMLYVQFLQYTSTGRLANGALCDPTVGSYDPCDPRFRVTVGYVENSMVLAHQSLYDNRDAISFPTLSRNGIAPAPLKLVGKYVWIAVEVVDLDSGVDGGLMGRFSSRLNISANAAERDLVLQNQNLRLTLRYWFLCEYAYYGEYCDVYCRDNAPYSICDTKTGAKICLYGQVDPLSNCYTEHPCRTCVCRNGGTCLPQGAEGYRCVCQGSYTGTNCETCNASSCGTRYNDYRVCDLCNDCELVNSYEAIPARTTACPIPEDDVAFKVGVAIGVVLDIIMFISFVAIWIWLKKHT